MSEPVNKIVKGISMGFRGGSDLTGLSVRFLQLAAKDPNLSKRLKTVRVNRRRLILYDDLQDWLDRIAVPDDGKADGSKAA